jgi:hypothetical protein
VTAGGSVADVAGADTGEGSTMTREASCALIVEPVAFGSAVKASRGSFSEDTDASRSPVDNSRSTFARIAGSELPGLSFIQTR